ncbi:MAG: envelope stress response membrane protein PspC [Candidatus Sumerlaeota bacterium]
MHNNQSWKKGLYRSRHGVFMGVLKGIADYFDISVTLLRVIVVLLVIFSVVGFIPALIIYLIAAMIMKPEPVRPFVDRSDREFYESYAAQPDLAVDRLRRTYERLERRIARMESVVTSKEFQWRKRMEEK